MVMERQGTTGLDSKSSTLLRPGRLRSLPALAPSALAPLPSPPPLPLLQHCLAFACLAFLFLCGCHAQGQKPVNPQPLPKPIRSPLPPLRLTPRRAPPPPRSHPPGDVHAPSYASPLPTRTPPKAPSPGKLPKAGPPPPPPPPPPLPPPPPPEAHDLAMARLGRSLGVAFISAAAFLQALVVAYLFFKRRQMLKLVRSYQLNGSAQNWNEA